MSGASLHSSFKIFFLFFIVSFRVLPQADSADIWIKRLEKNPDDIISLDYLTGELCYKNPKKALLYCDMLIELSKKQNNSGGLINGYTNKSIALRELSKYKESLQYNLKAIKVAEESKDSLNIGHTYNTLAVFYHVNLNYKDAEKYYLKALKIFETINKGNSAQNHFVIISNLSDV